MSPTKPESLARRYDAVRARTEALVEPLSPEDQQIQSMQSCSPTKWHLAHTTWFFETFVLLPRGVTPFDASYGFLFNSYYEDLGPRHGRPQRGLLSRPDAREVTEYRRVVDDRMGELLDSLSAHEIASLAPMLELGIAHEEQHQELVLTDILHAFAANPAKPAYRKASGPSEALDATPLRFAAFEGGLVEVGAGGSGFAFDNECPRHCAWLEPFALADRLVTVGEVKGFIADRGYETPSLWLAEGLDHVRAHGVTAPLYSRLEHGDWVTFSLEGERVARDDEPAGHLSFYEADAIARWLGGRLPSEIEWEHAAASASGTGHFLDEGPLRAAPASGAGVRQLYGDLWEWTRSAYAPYPGYAPAAGAVGEYNGKFMVNQMVLRGGSFATPPEHVRASYRNFWHPDTRFQFTGARVAKDA